MLIFIDHQFVKSLVFYQVANKKILKKSKVYAIPSDDVLGAGREQFKIKNSKVYVIRSEDVLGAGHAKSMI